jgi:hypothetical protein
MIEIQLGIEGIDFKVELTQTLSASVANQLNGQGAERGMTRICI